MKKVITICLILITAFIFYVQEKQTEVCNCPEPERVDYDKICSYTRDKKLAIEESLNYLFEEHLLKISCANLKNDSKETIIQR